MQKIEQVPNRSLDQFIAPFCQNSQIGVNLTRLISDHQNDAFDEVVLESILEDEFYKITHYVYFTDSIGEIKQMLHEDWCYMNEDEQPSEVLFEKGQCCYIEDLGCYSFIML